MFQCGINKWIALGYVMVVHLANNNQAANVSTVLSSSSWSLYFQSSSSACPCHSAPTIYIQLPFSCLSCPCRHAFEKLHHFILLLTYLSAFGNYAGEQAHAHGLNGTSRNSGQCGRRDKGDGRNKGKKKKKKPTRLLCEMRIEVELVVNVNWKILIVQVMRRFYLVYQDRGWENPTYLRHNLEIYNSLLQIKS